MAVNVKEALMYQVNEVKSIIDMIPDVYKEERIDEVYTRVEIELKTVGQTAILLEEFEVVDEIKEILKSIKK